MRIYYAGPLFSQAELEFNDKVAARLRACGFDVFLPQENTADIRNTVTPEMMKGFFRADLDEIDSCDLLLLVMDGRVPDEGACFELGYAYAKGKQCIGLKTDIRVSEYGQDNAMLLGSLDGAVVHDVDSLIAKLRKAEMKHLTEKGEI